MLRIGFGTADFTPPIGVAMGAFPDRQTREARYAVGVAAPLFVRALALGAPEPVVCLAVADVCLWQSPDVEAIRRAIDEATGGIPVVAIPVATHTHASVESTYQFGGSPDAPEIARLREATVGAVIAAIDDLASATVAVGAAPVPFNHNRRVILDGGGVREMWVRDPTIPSGFADPTLTLVTFERSGREPISVIHWAAHPLCLGRDNRLLSPDFPGALIDGIEKREPGRQAIFLNGAAGDINPHRCLEPDLGAVAWLRERLLQGCTAAAASAVPFDPVTVRFRRAGLTFPNRVDPSLVVNVELSALRLEASSSALVLGLVPGEPFNAFQRWFQQSLGSSVRGLVVGYAGPSVGYLPPRAEFDRGGYGITPDPRDPAEFSRTRLRRGVPELIFTNLLELSKR